MRVTQLSEDQDKINGFVNIDKPQDWTSHDVVAKLRRVLGTKRVGHAGTLDPFATGVLPVAVGSATRLIRFLNKSKKYLAEVDLSKKTDTDDYTGEVIEVNESEITEEEFKEKLSAMIGEFDQVPPLYSAKKINGKKLYELMREGHELDLSEIKSNKVLIKDIKVISFDYPLASFEVSCGEGTYIRSIARDCGGHLTKLRRLESNGFDLESSIRFEDLEDGDLAPEELLLDARDYLKLPKKSFERKEVIFLQQGRQLFLDKPDPDLITELEADDSDEKYMMCLDEAQELIGLARIHKKKGGELELHPKVIL